MTITFRKLGATEDDLAQARAYGLRYTKSQRADLIRTRSISNPSNHELSGFEASTGLMLHPEYRRFLQEINGGIPDRKIFRHGNQEYTVHLFLLMAGVIRVYDSVENHRDVFQAEIPGNMLPFAKSPGGDLFLIGASPDILGQIFYWQHAGAGDEDGALYCSNVTQIASGFDEFVEGLADA